MLTKSKFVHIHRANKVTVSAKATGPTCPISAFGLVFVPTYRTLATGSSFRASEAHDVSLFCLVGQIVDIPAIFPRSHPLVVVPSAIPVADTMRVTDKELAYFLLNTKVDHLACCLVSQITDTTLCSRFDLVLGTLQLLPPARIVLALGLLPGKFSQLLASLPFERPNTTSRYHDRLSCVGRNSGKVDFPQVYRRLYWSWGLFSLWLLDTHMQFKAMVPDKATSTTLLRQFNWQDNGCAALAHRQHHTSMLLADRLSGPFNRIEALGAPGILHVHLGMGLTELTRGIDGGKKSTDHHLDRLAVQGKVSFGGLLQCIAFRPLGMRHPCLFMDLTTAVPHVGSFHLSRFQTSKQLRARMQSVDMHGMHSCLLALLLFLDMLFHGSQNLSIEGPIMLFRYLFHLFQQMSRKPNGERLCLVFHAVIVASNCNYVKRRVPLSSPPLQRDGTPRAFLLRFPHTGNDKGVSTWQCPISAKMNRHL